jgi:hypothetical protein
MAMVLIKIKEEQKDEEISRKRPIVYAAKQHKRGRLAVCLTRMFDFGFSSSKANNQVIQVLSERRMEKITKVCRLTPLSATYLIASSIYCGRLCGVIGKWTRKPHPTLQLLALR